MRTIRISFLTLGLVLFVAAVGSAADSSANAPLTEQSTAPQQVESERQGDPPAETPEGTSEETTLEGGAEQRTFVCECSHCEDFLNACTAACAPADWDCRRACLDEYHDCTVGCS